MEELDKKLKSFKYKTGIIISRASACSIMGIDTHWIYEPNRYTGKQEKVKKAVKELDLFSYLKKHK